MKFVKEMVATASAFALLATPVVASAAATGAKVEKTKLGQRLGGRSVAKTTNENAATSGVVVGVIGVAVLVGGLAAAGVFDGDDNDGSPS